MKNLGQEDMPSWARSQYLLASVEAGARSHQAGTQYTPECNKTRSGVNSIELWAHLCMIEWRAEGGARLSRVGPQNPPDKNSPDTNGTQGWG